MPSPPLIVCGTPAEWALGDLPGRPAPGTTRPEDAGSLLPPYEYQGRGDHRSGPSRGEAKASHLLLHQVQGQGSTVRQGRR